jgi:hypothetical protein
LESVPAPEAADTDNSGKIDAIDAALILQHEAAMISELPPE